MDRQRRRRRPGNASDRDPTRVGSLVDQLVGRHGVARSDVLSIVVGSWSEVVGADIARRTRPVDLRGGVLTVEVDDPAWATQLRFLTAAIAGRVDELVGRSTVGDVRIRVARAGRTS